MYTGTYKNIFYIVDNIFNQSNASPDSLTAIQYGVNARQSSKLIINYWFTGMKMVM